MLNLSGNGEWKTKKYIGVITVLFALSFVLIACSDSNENVSEENNNESSSNENSNESEGQKENTDEDKNLSSGPDSPQEITEEDQMDLKIGDTGKISTSIGSFEMTVTDAKLMNELDGQKSELDKLILLDINLKNTSERPFKIEDMLSSTVVNKSLEGSGWHNGAEFFDSVEDPKGELAPGEDKDIQFITEVYESDSYYFMQGPGATAAGTTNQAVWTIPTDEIDVE